MYLISVCGSEITAHHIFITARSTRTASGRLRLVLYRPKQCDYFSVTYDFYFMAFETVLLHSAAGYLNYEWR